MVIAAGLVLGFGLLGMFLVVGFGKLDRLLVVGYWPEKLVFGYCSWQPV
jgi:hypothetical protein